MIVYMTSRNVNFSGPFEAPNWLLNEGLYTGRGSRTGSPPECRPARALGLSRVDRTGAGTECEPAICRLALKLDSLSRHSSRLVQKGRMVEPRSADPLVLVLEDEVIIGLNLVDELQDGGYRVAGPFTSCADALAWLRPRRRTSRFLTPC